MAGFGAGGITPDPTRPGRRFHRTVERRRKAAAGAKIAIVGPTRAGKSTLLGLLPRFYDPSAGVVEIDGVDLREYRLQSLRRQIPRVRQPPLVFPLSIRDNIAYSRPGADEAAIGRAARLASIDRWIAALPEGYDTIIGERGVTLSGGQRQRLAIARALVVDPRVLILDDATSAVDPTKEHEIREALRQVMEGRTTIVIAHRPATIALADRVVVLAGGRVIAEGDHVALLASSKEYRDILAEELEGADD
jgi:ATP-binding cassette, subfamily B, bacterial